MFSFSDRKRLLSSASVSGYDAGRKWARRGKNLACQSQGECNNFRSTVRRSDWTKFRETLRHAQGFSTMKKEIRLNAFAMNCVAHQSPGLWTHPRDRTAEYNRLPYWTHLAKTLERGRFDGLFLADVLGVYDVFGNSPDAALRNAEHISQKRSEEHTSELQPHFNLVHRLLLPK